MRDTEIVATPMGLGFKHSKQCNSCGKIVEGERPTRSPLEEPKYEEFWSVMKTDLGGGRECVIDLCPVCGEEALRALRVALHGGSWISREAQTKMKEAV